MGCTAWKLFALLHGSRFADVASRERWWNGWQTMGKHLASDGKGGSGVSMWSKSESSVVVCGLFLKPSSPRRAERQIAVFCDLCESTGCFIQRWRGAVLRRDGRSIDLGLRSVIVAVEVNVKSKVKTKVNIKVNTPPVLAKITPSQLSDTHKTEKGIVLASCLSRREPLKHTILNLGFSFNHLPTVYFCVRFEL